MEYFGCKKARLHQCENFSFQGIADFPVFSFALTLWGSHLWGSFVTGDIVAWLLGIGFQDLSIAPLRGISAWKGIWAMS